MSTQDWYRGASIVCSSRRLALVLSFLVWLGRDASAQGQPSLRGRVIDAQQRTPVPGATVVLYALPDTVQRWGSVANPQGEFHVELPKAGRYRLRITAVGYRPLERVFLLREPYDAGDLEVETAPVQTGEVTVEAVQERAVVKQDTVEYAASAYRVNPDATAEELVRKLPGVTVQRGQLQAHGETVQRVLVDGREFFGRDPAAVLRNLPASIVQAVQVFDRESDQARLTGIRDPGTAERTLNIITNPAMRTGRFGRLYGGYGSSTRYQAGMTLNFFRDTLRVSLVGMSNNVNQQNFALDDVLGIINFAGQQTPSGGPPPTVLRMMFQGGRLPGPPGGMRGGPRGPFAQLGTFFIPEQSGINTAHALGAMYSNRWGSWIDVTGSYFFNTLVNTSDAVVQRRYFSSDTLGLLYGEHSRSEGTIGTHRLSLRVELSPDTMTTLLIAPRFTVQPTESTPATWNVVTNGTGGDTVSQVTTTTLNTGHVLQSSIHALFVRRFALGRSFSLELEGDYDPRRQQMQQFAELSGHIPQPWDSTFAQRMTRTQTLAALTLTATYSEPLDSFNVLQFRYVPAWDWSVARQEAWGMDTAGNVREQLSFLASDLQRHAVEQRLGIAYLYQGRELQWNVRLDHSWQRLWADEQKVSPWSVERRFHFWLPSLMVEYRPTRMRNLRAVYRPFVTLPSATQLQKTVDNSNPMVLTAGNPQLRPSYVHTLFARYNAIEPFSGRLFFAMLRLQYSTDYISTATTVADRDTTVEGVPLPRGGQFSVPVNMEGYWSGRTFWVLGTPVPWLRSTLNVNIALDYSRTPTVVNGENVRTEWYAPALGASLSSNWSERVDFTLSYNLSYNRVRATTTMGSSTYLQHSLSADVTLMPASWVLASQLRLSRYNGLGDELDRPLAIWNLGVGYRFLENNAAEIRFVVTDLLNQNRGISRSVTGQYVEDSTTRVLGRYAMLMLSYRIRNFAL
ncbi:MAG: outer membrane beta-barrel protein [Bacteroidota bacterium]|nr:outer membrane beta-barrel protein [Bacteroidota bacterium]